MDKKFTNDDLDIEERKIRFRYTGLTILAMILPILPFAYLSSLLSMIPIFSYLADSPVSFFRGFSINWFFQLIVLLVVGFFLGRKVSSKIISYARENKIFSALPYLIGIGCIGGAVANAVVYFDIMRMGYGSEVGIILLFAIPIGAIIGGIFALIIGSIALAITDSLHYKKLRNGGYQLINNFSNEIKLNNKAVESMPLNEVEETINKRYMYLTAVALSGPSIIYYFFFGGIFYGFTGFLTFTSILLIIAALSLFVLGLLLGRYVGKTIIISARKGKIYGSLGKLIVVGFLGGTFATALMLFAILGNFGEFNLFTEGGLYMLISILIGAVIGAVFALLSGFIALSITKSLHYRNV